MCPTKVNPSVVAICTLTVVAMVALGKSGERVTPDVEGRPEVVADSPALAVAVGGMSDLQEEQGNLQEEENDLQEGWCLTQIKWDEKHGQARGGACENGSCDDPAVRDFNVPNDGTPVKNIQIRFHVFANDDGTDPAATADEMVSQLATLNSEFAPHKIAFTGTTEFVNDTAHRSVSDAEVVTMKNTYADTPGSQMNVYVVVPEKAIYATAI